MMVVDSAERRVWIIGNTKFPAYCWQNGRDRLLAFMAVNVVSGNHMTRPIGNPVLMLASGSK